MPAYFKSCLPNVAQLSPIVWRVLGDNVSPRHLQGTNIYIVGSGPRRILIDTGSPDRPKFLQDLSTTLAEIGASIQDILLTHRHDDHTGGVADVVDALQLGSDIKVSKFPRHPYKEEQIGDGRLKYTYLQDGQKVVTEGATLRAVYTPGHTDDHMILVLEEENAIFTGDCILGEGTAVFEDYNPYIKSLEKLVSFQPDRLYPGHGPVVDEDPVSKIQMYIDHRKMRDRQISNILEQNKDKTMTVMDLVRVIYTDAPECLLDAAGENVVSHVEKLLREGKIEKTSTGDQFRWKSSI